MDWTRTRSAIIKRKKGINSARYTVSAQGAWFGWYFWPFLRWTIPQQTFRKMRMAENFVKAVGIR